MDINSFYDFWGKKSLKKLLFIGNERTEILENFNTNSVGNGKK